MTKQYGEDKKNSRILKTNNRTLRLPDAFDNYFYLYNPT